jgi:WD40 repeat protein
MGTDSRMLIGRAGLFLASSAMCLCFFASLPLGPDGPRKPPPGRPVLVCGVWADGVKADQTLEVALPTHAGAVSALAFSPDGRVLASGAEELITLWEVPSGKQRTLIKSGNDVRCLAWSPDNRTVAQGTGFGYARLWNTATQKETLVLRHFNAEKEKDFVHSSNMMEGIAFSPDGKILATAANGVRLWTLGTGKAKADLRSNIQFYSVAFAPDGTSLAAGTYFGGVLLWDLPSMKARALLSQSDGLACVTVAYSPDSKTLAAWPYGSPIRFWNHLTRTELPPVKLVSGITAIAFSPKTGDVALAGAVSGRNVIQLCDWRRSKIVRTMSGHRVGVSSLAFSPDGAILASGSYDGTAKLSTIKPR